MSLLYELDAGWGWQHLSFQLTPLGMETPSYKQAGTKATRPILQTSWDKGPNILVESGVQLPLYEWGLSGGWDPPISWLHLSGIKPLRLRAQGIEVG